MENNPTVKPGLDWSQWYWPGPKRVLTDAELARAGGQPWPRGLDLYVMSNLILVAVLAYQLVPWRIASYTFVAAIVLADAAVRVARSLWRRPDRRRLNLFGYAISVLPALMFGVVSQFIPKPVRVQLFPALLLLMSLSVLTFLGWLALVIFRVHQVDARLKEMDEQERNVRLARRLATAQIQPHFLFNTLASVQHWVDTRDERAGPTLQSFTRYLRATLPMFERETLSLAEELQIVRSYLEVMQARLGARLAWGIDAPPGDEPALPPGALLTLVENAIAHGIEPALRGGRVEVQVQRGANGQWTLDVSNEGAELKPDACDGLGLSNTRERLRQQFGAAATLTLTPLSPGCRARIEILTP